MGAFLLSSTQEASPLHLFMDDIGETLFRLSWKPYLN